MEAYAKARFIKSSARKMRQVLNLVRGRNVEEALNILRFTHKKSAMIFERVLRSAVANAQNVYGDKLSNPGELMIVETTCDEGPALKRIRPRAMGRASKIRKRTCHLKIVVASE